MLETYEEGKDLYALIGSKCFHNNYEDNLEFHPVTHVLQPEGKARRSKAKVVQLAISYGMGPPALAEKIDVSIDEAKKIIEDFYIGFPGVKKFTEESQAMLRKYGYVTDMWGRRRRIPDGMLPEFEVISNRSEDADFNPFLHCTIKHTDGKTQKLIEQYKSELKTAKYSSQVQNIKDKAAKDGIEVKDNRGYINRALRQCLNARIQATAASMTKTAMIAIDNDEILNSLGFKLLVTVHDEVFGECPRVNSEAAAKRLSEIMVAAAKTKCTCKFKCDGYTVSRWYEDEASAEVTKDYNKYIGKGKTPEEAYNLTREKYPMIKEEYFKQMCDDTYECNVHADI